jgi:hypothetical protein
MAGYSLIVQPGQMLLEKILLKIHFVADRIPSP